MEENKYIEDVQYVNVDNTFYDVLPIKNTVLFPGVLLPIAVSKKSSLKLCKAANKDNRQLILLTQKDGKVAEPNQNDLESPYHNEYGRK